METMLRIAWVEPAYVACLKIAIEIGVFRALAKGGRGSKHTLNDLAEVTNTDSAFLGMWLPHNESDIEAVLRVRC